MRIYTCNDFRGHWGVGTAAVISASNPEEAAKMMEQWCREHGLEQTISVEQMIPFRQRIKQVRVLRDGNY